VTAILHNGVQAVEGVIGRKEGLTLKIHPTPQGYQQHFGSDW